MGLEALKWENHLLNLAYEAQASQVPEDRTPFLDQWALDAAYERCETITREYSRTFYMASGLLPLEKRRAIRALYAFCRVSDDLVDRTVGEAPTEGAYNRQAAEALEGWKRLTSSSNWSHEDPVAAAWWDTRRNFQIPSLYADQLIEGVARDLSHVSYETFDELAQYCYGVACTVGLMSMHIIGFAGQDALPYAIRLGVALQLTNILRDVGEDWRAGRVYLPREELRAFGLTETDFAVGRVTPAWREMMRFQIERNRRLYTEALPGIRLLDPDGRFAVEAAAELYRAILEDIDRHDYDVFQRRASIGKWGKLRRLPGIWWRASRE